MKWISVKDRLPEHHETILAFTPKGQSVCIFVDGKIMESVIASVGVKKENGKPAYYFCSQEIKGAVLNGVSHWMPLPPSP